MKPRALLIIALTGCLLAGRASDVQAEDSAGLAKKLQNPVASQRAAADRSR